MSDKVSADARAIIWTILGVFVIAPAAIVLIWWLVVGVSAAVGSYKSSRELDEWAARNRAEEVRAAEAKTEREKANTDAMNQFNKDVDDYNHCLDITPKKKQKTACVMPSR